MGTSHRYSQRDLHKHLLRQNIVEVSLLVHLGLQVQSELPLRRMFLSLLTAPLLVATLRLFPKLQLLSILHLSASPRAVTVPTLFLPNGCPTSWEHSPSKHWFTVVGVSAEQTKDEEADVQSQAPRLDKGKAKEVSDPISSPLGNPSTSGFAELHSQSSAETSTAALPQTTSTRDLPVADTESTEVAQNPPPIPGAVAGAGLIAAAAAASSSGSETVRAPLVPISNGQTDDDWARLEAELRQLREGKADTSHTNAEELKNALEKRDGQWRAEWERRDHTYNALRNEASGLIHEERHGKEFLLQKIDEITRQAQATGPAISNAAPVVTSAIPNISEEMEAEATGPSTTISSLLQSPQQPFNVSSGFVIASSSPGAFASIQKAPAQQQDSSASFFRPGTATFAAPTNNILFSAP
ncbi:MAG: hypothetical protein MMC33_006909 [Icmadophila ericetorum]|nr:hypothetical protein [Icmadophila ericetorum]